MQIMLRVQRAVIVVLLVALGVAWTLAPTQARSFGNTFENDLAKLIFHGTAIADLAENDSSSPATSLYLSLHTSDCGELNDQTTNEVAYTSYARAAVLRSSSGFSITSNIIALAANVDFPAGTGGSGTATHFGVGTASSGAGKLLACGTISPNIVTGDGVTPRLTAATTITLD